VIDDSKFNRESEVLSRSDTSFPSFLASITAAANALGLEDKFKRTAAEVFPIPS
jgi:hypothetical protein